MAGRVQVDRCGSRRRGDNRLSLERFHAKWMPGRVKKTRQNKEIEPPFRFNRNGGSSQTGRMWPPNRSSHMAKKLPPVHPGEILREEFLVPLKLTPYAVAAALHVPRTRIERIAREDKTVTAHTALRLGKFFKTGAAFWMNIQARFDLETAEDVLAPQIKKIASYEELRHKAAASRPTR